MQSAHVINYADPAIKNGERGCQAEIVRFVRGIRRPREAAVTAGQICKWLKVTPDEFVQEQIDAACNAGRIRIRQKSLSSGGRFNGAYVYEAV